MLTVLVLILIGVGIFIFLQMQKKNIPGQATPKAYHKDDLRIENVGAGGVLHLLNIGPQLEEFDVTILAKHIYREGESIWYELEGDNGTEKVWIDLEEDDETECSISLKKIKFRDISISKGDLIRMDDEEEGEFRYNNETFYYEDSGEAVFYRNGEDKAAETFYYWDFENKDGSLYIGIEKWSNGTFDISLSQPIKTSQITVYSNTKKD